MFLSVYAMGLKGGVVSEPNEHGSYEKNKSIIVDGPLRETIFSLKCQLSARTPRHSLYWWFLGGHAPIFKRKQQDKGYTQSSALLQV